MLYKIYRKTSPLFKLLAVNLGLSPGACRYTPTCSLYAKQAITKHGVFIGSWLALRRLLQCHPWSKGGYDPIP